VKDRLGVIAVLALGLAWGYNWVVIKIATHDASPFVLVALRQVVGAAALFALVAILRKPLRSPPIAWTALIGIVQIAIMTLLQTLALAVGGAGKVTVLVYTFPVWIIILSAIFLGEPLTRHRILVAAIAIAGLAFVLYPLDVTHAPLSVVFALGSALTWAAGAIITKKFRAKYDVDLVAFTAWQMAYGAVPLVIIAALVPGGYLHPTPSFFASFAYIVVLGTALAFWLWFFIMERFSAATAGVSGLLVPVISVFAAWVQLHERPSATESIGIALIIAALLVNSLPGMMPRRPKHGIVAPA
jgi:drug/metabolite transporter (DMT)-like permease